MSDAISSSSPPEGSKENNNSSSSAFVKAQSHRTSTCTHAANNIASTTTNLHTLLLLSDSALPLGSFAFSGGLESYYAHQKRRQQQKQQQQSSSAAFAQPTLSPVAHLTNFLNLSLLSTANFALPYIFAAHAYPTKLLEIDDFCDASTTCAVARRASVAQGRALLTVWERSFSSVLIDFTADNGDNGDGSRSFDKGSDSCCSCSRSCHSERSYRCQQRRVGDCEDQIGGSGSSNSKSISVPSGEQDGNAHESTHENAHAHHHTSNSHENVKADANPNSSTHVPKSNTQTTTTTKITKPATPITSKAEQAAHALSALQSLLRKSGGKYRNKNDDSATATTHPEEFPPTPSAHYAPLWGAVTRAANLSDAHSAAYVFLFGHARAVISAGVRSGMLGPYQAQGLLAGTELRKGIDGLVADAQTDADADADVVGQVEVGGSNDDKDDKWMIGIERSAQAVPVMDLWMGRHELLYSRIFNS